MATKYERARGNIDWSRAYMQGGPLISDGGTGYVKATRDMWNQSGEGGGGAPVYYKVEEKPKPKPKPAPVHSGYSKPAPKAAPTPEPTTTPPPAPKQEDKRAEITKPPTDGAGNGGLESTIVAPQSTSPTAPVSYLTGNKTSQSRFLKKKKDEGLRSLFGG